MICMCTAKVANAQMHTCLTAQLSKYIQLYKCRTLLTHAGIFTESQKPRQRVSNADRKVFAKSLLLGEEFSDILENVQILYKISR